MKIYTSYFAKMRYLPETVKPIAICISQPKWYSGTLYKKLAPSYSILNEYKQFGDKKLYTDRFNKEILNDLEISEVLKDLTDLSDGKDIALICYEKSGDFCHRYLVADWLKQNGIEVSEWK